MPKHRLSMRKIREVLRLQAMKLSVRQIAQSLDLGPTTVYDYLRRAKARGLSWPLPEDIDDAELEKLLFVSEGGESRNRPEPDWPRIHTELRRKHVTLALLWQEYKEQHPDGYQYSRFCDLYREWERPLRVWMRQEHRGGEKLFVDFAGDGVPWEDPRTGEIHEAQLFVGVLGASNYTYVEATETQRTEDWIRCHVHALEFFGGVPAICVPDQTRTAVRTPCRYDPELNPIYAEFGRYYNLGIIPARPRKPRDKAKAEAGVLLAARWIIAALRHYRFHSVREIQEAIPGPLQKLNHRKMRRLGLSRYELYLQVDKPNLKPLPDRPFEFAEWRTGLRVNLDYHVAFDFNFYSVPYQYAHQVVDVRATSNTVEIFLGQRRLSSHGRLYGKYQYSTLKEHMPHAHREHADWPPSRILSQAKAVGPATAALVEAIMDSRPHPEQGFRACLGILRLAKHYGDERLEKASKRALAFRCLSYRSVASILQHKLEEQPLPESPSVCLPHHENIRGGTYYA